MKWQLTLATLLGLLATIAVPAQANPHYTNWNGFKADMHEGGWSLAEEAFIDPHNITIEKEIEIIITGSVIHDGSPEGRIGGPLRSIDFVSFTFTQELSAFGFDYGDSGSNNSFSSPFHFSESVKMEVLDSSGKELPLLSAMVPPSNNLTSQGTFYGIGDKNFPLQFKTIRFINVGTETGNWGMDNLYYAPIIPLPTASFMALPLLFILGAIRKVRAMF